MYNTNSGFQPTKHFKLLEKPKSLSWKKLNKCKWENRIHWLCFYLPSVEKAFNVYYPDYATKGEEITILIDTNHNKEDWREGGVHTIDWIEGKIGLFESEIKPRLWEWIENTIKQIES